MKSESCRRAGREIGSGGTVVLRLRWAIWWVVVGLAGVWGRAGVGAEAGGGVLERLREMSVEELLEVRVDTVYAASRHEQKLSEAPASVSVVTSDDIRKFGYRTLAEVLRGVRGFYVTYDRGYGYTGVRGINRPGDYGGRVLVLINGHRINDPIYNSSPSMGDFPMDLDLVERIEVVRGPGHTLYGDNAFLAVINVIPKTGATIDGVEGSATVMSQGDYAGRVTYGTRTKGGVEVLVSGTFRERAGHEELMFPEYGAVNGGLAEGLDGESVKQLQGSVGYDGLTFSGFFGERRKDLPTAQYGAPFNQGPYFAEDRRWGMDLRYEREVGEDWQVLGRLYGDGYGYKGIGPYPSVDPGHPLPYVFNDDRAEALFGGAEGEVSRVFFEEHRVSVGGEYRADLELRQWNVDRYALPVRVTDTEVSEDRVALYLQDEYSIRTNLIVGGALRYDHFSSFGSTWNPRGSVVWSPGSSGAAFKALYAEAFRSPNAYERFYEYPGFLPNPDLEPERNRSYELVWEQQWGGGPWRSAASGFYHDMTGFITQMETVAGDYIFANLDAVTSKGGEVEVEGRWRGGLSVRMSYTYALVEERRPGLEARTPANSPAHLAKAALTVPVHRDRVFGSVEVQAMSDRRRVGGGEAAGYATANLVVFGRELLPGLEATVGIYNLLDHRWVDPVTPDFRSDAVEQDGRTFRLKVTYRY